MRRMLFSVLFSAFSFMSVGTAFSQDGASCIGILDRVNYNLMRNSSKLQQEQINTANLCASEYSKASKSQQASIEASYSLFSGSAAAGSSEVEELQKSKCEGRFGSYWLEKVDNAEQRVASAEALQTVERCIALSNKAHIDIRTVVSEDNRQVDFVVRWRESGPLRIKYAGPQPFNSLECFVDGAKATKASHLSADLAGNSEWSFTCRRAPEQITQNQETYSCLPPVNIMISTELASESIPLPRYCDTDMLASRANRVDAEVQKLRQEIDVLRSAQTAIQTVASTAADTATAERTQVRYTFVPQSEECPSGWTNLGIIGFIMRNDFYGNNLGGGSPHNNDWKWTHPKLCRRN